MDKDDFEFCGLVIVLSIIYGVIIVMLTPNKQFFWVLPLDGLCCLMGAGLAVLINSGGFPIFPEGA